MNVSLPGATPHSLKLRVLQQPERLTHRLLVYADCDVMVLDRLLPMLADDALQFRAGRTGLHDWARSNSSSWPLMFHEIGRPLPPLPGSVGEIASAATTRCVALLNSSRAVNSPARGPLEWLNTGVFAVPGRLAGDLYALWMQSLGMVLRIQRRVGDEMLYFAEELALVMALHSALPPLPYRLMPVQFNAQLSLSRSEMQRNGFLASLEAVPPAMLHYAVRTLRHADGGALDAFSERESQDFPFLRAVNGRLAEFNRRWFRIVPVDA
jgi:hypothetical protein